VAVRTQIYLPEALHRRLKSRARILNKPMAVQIREALERYLATEEAPEPIPDDPIWSIPDYAVGGAAGSPRDIAARHDEYLYREEGIQARRRGRGRNR
jgi:hypothetical protein